ncbi:hypothetical protein [Paracoccus albus]|uniref:hypothetical protein n=1 Tax=Paracoccus albus TaxID=3017784 RepID=UPI0022F12B23|nr:hypothetical protein [Paracoccus albus]WBU60600.1 hypothetical protein PAF20_01345 [Paracoccus albus]
MSNLTVLALGLIIISVQATPAFSGWLGEHVALALKGGGPALGVAALRAIMLYGADAPTASSHA